MMEYSSENNQHQNPPSTTPSSSSPSPFPQIFSKDIHPHTISLPEFYKMKESFPGHHDEDLLRFLISKDGNYSLAYDMYRKHLDWLEKNPKPYKEQILESLYRKWLYVHGYDRDNHPLLIAKISRHNKENRNIDEIILEQLWWLDHLLAMMPRDKSKFTVLIDRTDVSSLNQDVELMEQISEVFQANFPERLHRVIVYPTGLMFYGIWNIIQYFLPPKTRERVCPQLSTTGCLQYVEPQYLPITMGGTSVYEPDIDTLEDPPSMIHSILSKTKKLSPQRTMNNNGNSLNYSQPSPLPSSQISRISDYRRVSVSIDINDDEEDDGLEEYAASEFGDELNLYRSSENNSTQITPLNGQKLSTEKINKFSPFSSLTSSKYRQYCPAMMKGWGIKQGHIVKNWKRRYFILTSQHEVTLLRYYKEELSYPPYGEYLCGELNLQYYHLIPSQKLIKFDSNENEKLCNCIELIGESSLDKDLLICIEDSSEYNSWIGALEAHIDFRKEIEDILQQESSRSSWRCNIL